MDEDLEPNRGTVPWTRRLPVRIVVVVALLLALGAGASYVGARDDEPDPVSIELAGSTDTFRDALAGRAPSVLDGSPCSPEEGATCDPPPCVPGGEVPAAGQATCEQLAERAEEGVERDWYFIPAYALTAAIACLLGALVSPTASTKRWFHAAALAAVVAGLFDVVENAALLEALRLEATARPIHVAAWAATAKWALVPFFATAALIGIVVYLRRLRDATRRTRRVLHRRRHWSPPPATEGTGWERGSFGIALSGGGIRSASFALGALQRLGTPRPGSTSILGRARYLSAVSGGAYLAGAMQLHAAVEDDPWPYQAGSAEADHLRRHGNYLADTASEWVTALATSFLRLLGNIALLALAVIAVAQPIGWVGRLLVGGDLGSTARDAWPPIPEAVLVALAALGLPALVLALGRRGRLAAADTPPAPAAARDATTTVADRVTEVAEDVQEAVTAATEQVTAEPLAELEEVEERLTKGSEAAAVATIALGAGALTLLVTAVVVPLLDASAQHVADWVNPPEGAATAAWPGALAVALLGWVQKKALKRESSGGTAAAGDERKATRIPWAGSIVETLAGPVVILVVLAYVVALASLARTSGPLGPSFAIGSVGVPSWAVFAATGAFVLLVGLRVDAVDWSLHRFYKRRLWSAFTYDPTRGTERSWATRPTLSEHGVWLDGMPELVLCGAAQVAGPDLAPPGRRAVTWTFDSSWVGGPEIGWCETVALERALAAKGKAGDASLFGAVAISGAAFGSAMGRHSKGTLNSLLALSNTRLGVWLPNPRRVHDDPAWVPGRTRNLRYLVREVFGRYDRDDDWILVSDGGHYENLGVVELLRRGCRHIVCLDASGDASGRNATLAEALRLAEEELGVSISVDEPWTSAPGSTDEEQRAALPERLADALEGRLATSPVVSGTITYPIREEGSSPDVWPPADLPVSGHILVGRAIVDPGTPWPVLSYAGGNDEFPNDPTHDQWFDHEQFMNYRLLGRWVATRLEQVITEPGPWEPVGDPP